MVVVALLCSQEYQQKTVQEFHSNGAVLSTDSDLQCLYRASLRNWVLFRLHLARASVDSSFLASDKFGRRFDKLIRLVVFYFWDGPDGRFGVEVSVLHAAGIRQYLEAHIHLFLCVASKAFFPLPYPDHLEFFFLSLSCTGEYKFRLFPWLAEPVISSDLPVVLHNLSRAQIFRPLCEEMCFMHSSDSSEW